MRDPEVILPRVDRPRLTERFLAGLSRRLTLVEAPLGYGKTTLITSWVERLRLDHRRVRYLTLDGAKGDQLQLVLRELDAVGFRIGDRGLSPSGTEQVYLVLDDFHEAEPRCREFVQSVLGNPPVGLHMIIGSREPPGFPLTKLRMVDQVTDFSRDDLRFTRDEAQALFQNGVSAELLEAYLDRSEGWIAALHLLRQQNVSDGQPPDFDQVGKFADYLNEQYFDRLEPAQKEILLKTAHVDWVDGDLANLLTGCTDCWARLGDLASTNALIFKELSGSRTTYRYHQLLRDFLRAKQRLLGNTALDGLHLSASGWFGKRGTLFEAMQHACLAGDEARAEELLIKAGGVLFGMVHGAGLLAPCLALLSAGRIYASPRLMIAQSYLHFKEGRLRDASDLLKEVRAKLPSGDTSLEREIILVEAHARVYADTPMAGRQLEALEHAISATPASDPLTRGMLCNFMCMFQIEFGDFPKARDYGERAMWYYRDIGAAHLQFFMHLHLSAIDLETTNLSDARAGCDRALAILRDQFSYDASLQAIAEVYYGEAAFEAGQTDGLLGLLKAALDRVDRSEGWNMLYLAGYETCLSLMLEAGDFDDAIQLCEKGGNLVNRRGMRLFSNQLMAMQLDLATRAGAAQEARRLAKEIAGLLADTKSETRLRWRGQVRSELALARYQMNAKAYEDAAGCLERVIRLCGAIGAKRLLLRAQSLKFLMSARQSDAAASEVNLKIYLEKAAAHGGHGAILRDAREFREAALWVVTRCGLGRFTAGQTQALAESLWLTSGSRPAASANIMSELLTKKELGVLAELVKGSANKVIARTLQVSEPTVKFHLQNIYRKLGVNSRKLAIEITQLYGGPMAKTG